MFSEDYSLVMIEKPASSSSGVLLCSSVELSNFFLLFPTFFCQGSKHVRYTLHCCDFLKNWCLLEIEQNVALVEL